MEAPVVLCEQCGERLKLEARIAYSPFILIERDQEHPGTSRALALMLDRLPTQTVIFTAEKCRCPDQPGS